MTADVAPVTTERSDPVVATPSEEFRRNAGEPPQHGESARHGEWARQGRPPRPGQPSGRRVTGWYVLAAVTGVALLLGLFLRIWILGHAPMNSDEATIGLVANRILRGHFSAITWGQSYGGVEAYVVAMAFLLFGQSPFVLDATPAVLALVGCVLVWRIGRRLLAPAAGVVAGALAWVWSESSLWNSTRETGYHEVQMVLALGFLLQGVRIVQRGHDEASDRWADWVVLGLIGGVGIWASPEVVQIILATGVFLVVNFRSRPLRWIGARAAVVAAAALVGVFPWIWTTLHPTDRTPIPALEPFGGRLHTFAVHVLPMLLGLQVEGPGDWEGGRAFGFAVYGALVALVVACSVVLVVRRRDAWVLVLALALYPFLYAASPAAWFWNDGRYGLTLTPLLSLVLIGGLWQLVRPGAVTWVAGAVLLLACLSTIVAFNDGFGAVSAPGRLTTFSSDPNTAVHALAEGLTGLHVTRAYAGYWVADDLTFESGGRIDARSLTEATRNLPASSRPEATARPGSSYPTPRWVPW